MKIALIIEPEDVSYLPHIKPFLASPNNNVQILKRCPELVSEVSTQFDAAIVARTDFLKKLTFGAKGASLENYAGSLLHHNKKPFVVIDPIEQIVSTRTGEFLVERYLRKILKPDSWFKQSDFTWEIANEQSVSRLYDQFATADLIAVDIETTTDGTYLITCVGYCGIWFNPDGSFHTHCVVLPFTSMFWVGWVRKFNQLPQGKIFQNGLFDNQYFLRFGCPIVNWCFDTQELFHAWYSELPKRLDAISAFLLRDVYYWKQEGKTGNLEDYYRYNAKDTWATANSWLSLINECPQWALANYLEKFPLVFPCLACALEGIKVDASAKAAMEAEQKPKLEDSLNRLRKRIGKPNFNPGSWQQVLTLLHALGYSKETKIKDWANGGKLKDSTDKKVLAKIAKKHPLPQLLIGDLLEYREATKLYNSYIDAQLWNSRFLYSLAPSGTDTGRLASKGSSFIDMGNQVQNLPEYFKKALVADDGFHLFEIDNKNSEGYCVGYLSGDTNLLRVLHSGQDFHCANASQFFGIPYSDLFDDSTGTVLNKLIRMLAKRVNHGANYNMAENVLIETMGAENVLKARELLKLPADWTLRQIATYLLERYSTAYPDVKGAWYNYIKACVKLTKTLVSALGYTRYCFGEPDKNKPDLNAYVAHVPQNLSVGIVNRGFRRVFNQVQRPNWRDFRLKAQIHDSIFGQYRIGREDLVIAANNCMIQDVPVTDCKGITRTMRIPTDIKGGDRVWSELKKIKS